MRIAVMSSALRVDDRRATRNEAVSLARLGHQVAVFARDSSDGPASAVQGVELNVIAPAGGNLKARAKTLRPLCRAVLAWGPEAIICHEPESALAGLYVKARCGAQMVFDAREFYEHTLSSRLRWPLRPIVRATTRALLRFIARRCDWMTVVSPPGKTFYEPYVPAGRVDVILNSPRPEWFPPARQDLDGPALVCHDGLLLPERGMVEMLEALALARKHVPTRLVLVGIVVPQYRRQFDEAVARLGIADAVELVGWVPAEQEGTVLSQAQIGLTLYQPGRNAYQGLSNKLQNYMACGIVPIVPAGSVSAELVAHYDCGVAVEPTDVQAVAEAIVSLSNDPPRRARLGANGRRAILEELGWHKMEQRLGRIFAELGKRGQVPFLRK